MANGRRRFVRVDGKLLRSMRRHIPIVSAVWKAHGSLGGDGVVRTERERAVCAVHGDDGVALSRGVDLVGGICRGVSKSDLDAAAR